MYFYTYILRSKKHKKLYIGFTDDWEKRLRQHNDGEVESTKSYIPYELIFLAVFINKKDAINCEKYLKTTAGWRRIKKMLENTLKSSQ